MQPFVRSALSLVTLSLVAIGVYACSDHDHDHGPMPASCEAFHDDCVKLVKTSPKAKECDDLSHQEGVTEAQCAAKKNECVQACKPGGAVDAGAGDAKAD